MLILCMRLLSFNKACKYKSFISENEKVKNLLYLDDLFASTYCIDNSI